MKKFRRKKVSVTRSKNGLMVAEMTLSYNPKCRPGLPLRITTSEKAYEALMAKWDMGRLEFVEQFNVLFLNHAKEVIGFYNAATGSICGTLVDVRVIFAAALTCAATSMIVAHNHPSGNLSPSKTDIKLTEQLVAAGKILQIEVLDHFIITKSGYTSLNEQGII